MNNIGHKLYSKGLNLYNKKQQKSNEMKKEIEQRDLSFCSFKPTLTKRNLVNIN